MTSYGLALPIGVKTPWPGWCDVCYECDDLFNDRSQSFDRTFREYLEHHCAGDTRGTPAQRVRDVAYDNQVVCAQDEGTELMCWYLAIALERLVALETAGIPT